MEALGLLVAFAYSVKHRLRGEYGTDYDDYEGILPRWIARYEEGGYSSTASSPTEGSESYNAMGTLTPNVKRRKEAKTPPDGTRSPGTSSTWSQNDAQRHSHGIHFHEASMTLDNQSAITPLLSGNHRTVQFHPSVTNTKTPLPLV